MLDRLLDKLEPQRRHLAYLVGLLVLTFVLTGVLALHAQRAELEYVRAEEKRAYGTADEVVASWAEVVRENSPTDLAWSLPYPQLQEDHDVPLSALRSASRLAHVCRECDARLRAESFFSVDLATGRRESLGEPVSGAVMDEIVARSTANEFNPIHESIGMTVLFLMDGSKPRLAITYTAVNSDTVPERIVGVLTDSAAPLVLLRFALNKATGFPTTYVQNKTNSEVFAADVSVDGRRILAADEAVPLTSPVEISTPSISGVMLRLGLRPAVAEMMIPRRNQYGLSPMLLALVSLIAAVLAMALLLVRRESELVRLRAEFISGVSHELRTPLAQIRMFTETLLLGRTRSDIERRRSLEIIDQEARRLTHLVENVLTFSRGEGGRRGDIAREPTQFAGEIRRAIESFGPMARNRSAEIRAELQDNITAPIDRNALRQILVNLLENALKYGPEGQRITVGLALYDDVARVWVDDEGPGIPAVDRDRVFESFVRLRRDLEARVAGSGIGLSVVRELARLHGGAARAESAPGGGARIVVEFPEAYLRTDAAAGISAAS